MKLQKGKNTMKNNINETLSKYTAGEITLEQANEELKAAGAGFHLDPNKNVLTEEEKRATTIGHFPDQANGFGLLDSGTGTLDKVRVIETDERIWLAEPVFDAEAFKNGPKPVANVKYCEKWYTVAADGETLAEM